eukprot:1159416-Pelagomonas_calceolata.AAC.15
MGTRKGSTLDMLTVKLWTQCLTFNLVEWRKAVGGDVRVAEEMEKHCPTGSGVPWHLQISKFVPLLPC